MILLPYFVLILCDCGMCPALIQMSKKAQNLISMSLKCFIRLIIMLAFVK